MLHEAPTYITELHLVLYRLIGGNCSIRDSAYAVTIRD